MSHESIVLNHHVDTKEVHLCTVVSQHRGITRTVNIEIAAISMFTVEVHWVWFTNKRLAMQHQSVRMFHSIRAVSRWRAKQRLQKQVVSSSSYVTFQKGTGVQTVFSKYLWKTWDQINLPGWYECSCEDVEWVGLYGKLSAEPAGK